MVCQQCGNQLNTNSVFCTMCGASQNATGQPLPQQPLQPQQPGSPQQFAPQPPVQQPGSPQPSHSQPPVQPQPPPQQPGPLQQFGQQPPAQPQQFMPQPPGQHPGPQQFGQQPPIQPQQFISQPPQQQPQLPQFAPQAPQPSQAPPQNFTPSPHFAHPQPPAPPAKKSKTPIIIAISAIGVAAAVIVAAIILITSGVLGSNDQGPVNKDDVVVVTPGPSSEVLTPAQVYEHNIDSVFQILCFIDEYYIGWGSGFFISESGVAVTNHHVLDGIHKAIIIMEDGSEYDIMGYYNYDFGNDLAVIQVDGEGRRFQPVTIGRPDGLSVGDRVYAIGGPGGDPLTLTEGIISRFAHEPISYDIYTVAGMLQSTAFIYGGNSGGPLFNDRGHVIGVNSAGRLDRESTQWAVPIDRIEIPTGGAMIHQLPVGTSTTGYTPGHIFGFERFPDIPDFLSVSSNASLILSGTAVDMGYALVLEIDEAGIYSFDYAYLYSLPEPHWIPDTDRYDDVLEDNGFIFQGVEITTEDDDMEVTYVFLYNSRLDISLVYCYYWNYEALLILIGWGNTFEVLGGTISERGTDFIGYTLFPFVPDFGELVSRAQLVGYGLASEYGIDELKLDGNLYIVDDDYVYIYHLPEVFLGDGEIFIDLLLQNGFVTERQTYYEEYDIAAELYYNSNHGVFVSVLYAFEDEELWIAIG